VSRRSHRCLRFGWLGLLSPLKFDVATDAMQKFQLSETFPDTALQILCSVAQVVTRSLFE
jgi:hypothetical protein